ncbi:hypothetical protein [Streptomyces goshikiensis]
MADRAPAARARPHRGTRQFAGPQSAFPEAGEPAAGLLGGRGNLRLQAVALGPVRRRDRLGLARLAQRRAVPSVVVELRPTTGAGRARGLALGPLRLGRAARLLLVLLLLCSRPLCPAGEDGVQEIAALAGQRRHGAGSKLRTDLLTGITAKRTTLTVRPEAPTAWYDRLSYTSAGHTRPWNGAPVYRTLIKPLKA